MLHTKTQNGNEAKYNKYSDPPKVLPESDRVNKKSIITTNKGTITIKLFGEDAPLTVSNHIFLSNEGFYNDLIFHRREEGFVIQGGDPLGQGYGGPGYSFEDEPMTEEKYPRVEMVPGTELIVYKKGTVAMANSGPNTNGSQFFITLEDVILPPSYTIFGEVIDGIEIIDLIQIGDKMMSVKVENI